MRILGIDPGTATTGWAAADFSGNKSTAIDYGVIKTSKELSDSRRLSVIYNELNSILKVYKPDKAAVEKLFFFKNVKTVMTVSQARGVVLLCLFQNGIEFYEYTPLQLKQAIVGYGRAEKKQVQFMIQKIFNLKEKIKSDDAADALALCVTCKKFLSSKIPIASSKKGIKIKGVNKKETGND